MELYVLHFLDHATALDMRSNALSLGNTKEKVKVPFQSCKNRALGESSKSIGVRKPEGMTFDTVACKVGETWGRLSEGTRLHAM